MNIGCFYQRIIKLCFVFLSLSLLGPNSGLVVPVRAQEISTQVVFPNRLFTSTGLDEDASAWNVYIEGNPSWALSNVTSPSLDGRSLRCAITGGNPYSNVHCYRNLPAEPKSNVFSLNLSFYYQPTSSFNNVGEPSIVQGLEFTMNKWDQGLRYELALQWDNVDLGAPKWRYWNPELSPNWIDVGVSGPIIGEQWHTLTLEGGIFNGQVHYRLFIFDGQEYPLDVVVPSALAPSQSDRLAVAVQLDGNYIEAPYELFLDNVTLVTSETFGDVPFNYWAFDWINRLYAADITGGCSTNPLEYCPETSVTRAQMAVFLEKGLHYPAAYTPPDAIPTFNDTAGHWAEDWIEALKDDGVTAGCGGGNYCPNNPVTRAQMAVFLLKSKYGSGYTPPDVGGSTGLNDVPVTHWAAPWIKQLAAEGITGGCGIGNYCPNNPVTRAQMAVFLVKTFSLP